MPWDPLVETDIVAIHAALVPTTPTGENVFFEGFFGEQRGRSFAWRCDPGPGEDQIYELPEVADDEEGRRNLFCAGHAHLADGRWLVVGGTQVGADRQFIEDDQGNPILDEEGEPVWWHQHGHGGSGIRDTWAFKPREGTWERLADMNPQPNSVVRGGGRWYPTCVTLANGRVLAHGGHPIGRGDDMIDDWPTPGGRRHNNNVPEVYVPGLNTWMNMRDAELEQGFGLDEYNRMHLAPSGHVFFSTVSKVHGDTRLYDPYVGTFVSNGFGNHLDALYDDANCSAVTSSVMLPILHGDGANVWVLVAGAAAPERLNLAASSPQWMSAGNREAFPDDPSPPRRNNLHGIILPTGQVFFAFGVRNDTTDVQFPEIYTPAIDWSTGRYLTDDDGLALPGTWDTRTGAGEQSQRRRGYHSCAVLQPDGSVWAAGSTHGAEGDALTDPDASNREETIEVYRPNYGNNRPTINASPLTAGYGDQIRITMGSGAAMHRVVLVRCGSFTHAFDGDQRYLTLPFSQSGAVITATTPLSPNTAPPGYYMLYVLRNENTPSVQGRFVRIAHQDAFAVLQISTYSLLAVRAMTLPDTGTDEAVFEDAIDFIFEGFLPHELNVPAEQPEISFRFTTGDPDVPGMRIDPAAQDFEVNPTNNPDTAQRFRYVYNVVFENESAYDTFDDDQVRFIEVRATLGGRTISVNLTLMKRANPYMRDGNPHYLSDDLRIHKASVGDVNAVGGPQAYLQGLLDAYENTPTPDDSDQHPFLTLDTSQEENPVVLEVPQNDNGTYNFAIARVRFLSVPGEDAENVKVFFRMFNTVGTALEFNTFTTYRTLQGPGGDVPGLGKQGVSIISMPFFAAPRVTPDQSMADQQDNVVNQKTLFAAGPETAYRYYGCWLDVNTTEPHFPPFPKDDGPYGEEGFFIDLIEGGGPRSILDHVRGYHQCLVAEIQYDEDPTQPGQTPATSDNLSQRNLATVPVANPGLETITRTAQTTMDVKPSEAPTETLLAAQRQTVASTRRGARPDELVFERNNLPPGTRIEIYLPDVDIDEVLQLSAIRNGPPTLRRIDDNTLAFEPGPVSYVALPGGRELNIAGLISVTLPLGIIKGQVYTLSVKQFSGRTLRWVGAFDLRIPVDHGPDLLDGEGRKLSLLRYVFENMPENDRWFPVFERYLFEIAERVRGFGGNPESIDPSPHGTGTPGSDKPGDGQGDPNDGDPDGHDDPSKPGEGDGMVCFEGKICKVEYDCFGDPQVIVVKGCGDAHVRLCISSDIEDVVLMAWRERLKVHVYYRPSSGAGGAVNATCPWSGKPVRADATTVFEGRTVGFCSTAHRDRFVAIRDTGDSHVTAQAAPARADTCPWSGRPVLRDAIVRLSSGSVGFCSRAHHDRFRHAVTYFREIMSRLDADGNPIGAGGHAAPQPDPSEDGSVHIHDHSHSGGSGGRARQDVGSINKTCPWTRRPVSADALTTFEGHVVGFNAVEDRDRFEAAAAIAAAHYPPRKDRDRHEHGGYGGDHDTSGHAANEKCPVSGAPARAEYSAQVSGREVAFCSAKHRDDWTSAVSSLRACFLKSDPGCDAHLVRLVLAC
ncbi:galactose oxidase early set domain-containing protein [uncultured Roseobacter sp.]|uniref:galactose oxidase early set domain-containing protein n=1 Tax=uncultured Roseobacter sp. TaxID=114847 RepID=UPI00263798D0|nr:galactose oxidase early set domain-containing protein [uncultured Roseobacter sp.]